MLHVNTAQQLCRSPSLLVCATPAPVAISASNTTHKFFSQQIKRGRKVVYSGSLVTEMK